MDAFRPDPTRPRTIFGLELTNAVVGALRAAATRHELMTLMEAVTREMDFRYYALIHHDDLRTPRPDCVDLKDYPPVVTDSLFGQRRYRRDPVIRGCIFADSAFLWSDLSRIIRLDRQDRASFELGEREGLKARTALGDSICEEPHAYVTFRYDLSKSRRAEMHLTIKDGVVADHSFDQFYWRGLYTPLPAKTSSHEAALRDCRALAANTSSWTRALNVYEYAGERSRQTALMKAVESLPLEKIRCTGLNGRPCRYGRVKLLSVLQNTPPSHSESIFMPNEGTLYVYHYLDAKDAAPVDYDAMLRLDMHRRPQTLNLRFVSNLRPVI